MRGIVEHLEAESSELANKLLEGQVRRAEEAEAAFGVEMELVALRNHHLRTLATLDTLRRDHEHLLFLLQDSTPTPTTLRPIMNIPLKH